MLADYLVHSRTQASCACCAHPAWLQRLPPALEIRHAVPFLGGRRLPPPTSPHSTPFFVMQLIQEHVLKGYDSCCGVELPICTHFLAGTRVCHARINKGDHMLHVFRNLRWLNVSRDDVFIFNIGLWCVPQLCTCCCSTACSAGPACWVWAELHVDQPAAGLPLLLPCYPPTPSACCCYCCCFSRSA